MRLNQPVKELLVIFEDELEFYEKIIYRDCNSIDINRHLRLQQDRGIRYYTEKTHMLFVAYKGEFFQPYLSWQLREVYRLVNITLSSFSPTLSSPQLREKLTNFKNKLEKNEYLAAFLAQIDSGTLKASLVCAGHSTWYVREGLINLAEIEAQRMETGFPQDESTVAIYSGLGGQIADQLAVDIENEEYNPDEVIVEHIESGSQKKDSNFPLLFSRSRARFLPNFAMIDEQDEKSIHARVFQPMTGREFYSVKKEVEETGEDKNYFSLAKVLQRFPGCLIHLAGCTGQRLNDGTKLGPWLGYRWIKAPPEKKRSTEHNTEFDDVGISASESYGC